REHVLQLAEHLHIALRARNALLLAARYAPLSPERSPADGAMDPVRDALQLVLSGHEPSPAVIVARRGDLVSANGPALTLFAAGVAEHLLEAAINVYRLGLHPEGLAPRVRNAAAYTHRLLTRLQREVALSGDPALA